MKRKWVLVTKTLALTVVGWPAIGAENSDTTNQVIRGSDSSLGQEYARDRISKVNRAHQLIGMAVRDGQNEKLGKINDLIIDLPSGRVFGVVVSTGGVLGAGAKDYLVPPGIFTVDPAGQIVQLGVDKNKLTSGPEFDAHRWDSSVQQDKIADAYRAYGVNLPEGNTRPIPKGGRANTELASKVIGLAVDNHQNEKVGKVDDLIVNLTNGRITHVVVASGGFLGLGDEYSAVPPNAFGINEKGDALRLNITREAMMKAPHFRHGQWPNFEDTNYVSGVERSYNSHTYTEKSSNEPNNTGRNVRDRNGQNPTPWIKRTIRRTCTSRSRSERKLWVEKTFR